MNNNIKRRLDIKIEYYRLSKADFEPIYQLNREQIFQYEDITSINCKAVLEWIQKEIENNMTRYQWELEDFYLFKPFGGKGIGSAVRIDCIAKADEKIRNSAFMYFPGIVALSPLICAWDFK